jgi:hypothetical protein
LRKSSGSFATLAVIRCAEDKKPRGTNHAYKHWQASTVRVGTSMAVDGHSDAMTIPDYIAFGILIALAMWAGAMLYLRAKLQQVRGYARPAITFSK